MYLRRELNSRQNTYRYPDQEFGIAPQNKPSVSFKRPRKPLVASATRNMQRLAVSSQSEPSNESAARLTGTLTTLPHSHHTDDASEPSRD